MEIKRLTNNDFNSDCNSCHEEAEIDEHGRIIYKLIFNGISVSLCKTCLYDLEEAIISARIKKIDASCEGVEDE